MLHPDLVRLVDDILAATRAGHVDWKESAKKEDKEKEKDKDKDKAKEMAAGFSFLAKFPNYSIVIDAVDRPVLGVDNRDYVIDIIDNVSGRALERITAAAYGDAKENPIEGYVTMSEIFKLARRRALRISAAVTEITGGLAASAAATQAGTDAAAAPPNGADTGGGPAVTSPDGAQTGNTAASPTIPAGTPAGARPDGATP